MTKIIRKQINIVDPDWKPSKWDKAQFFSYPNYIRNEEVTKLFELQKVKNWQVDGGYIWLEVN